MSDYPELQTESEKIFAAYLDEHGYEWDHEPEIAGKRKRVDFRILWGGEHYFLDAKERAYKEVPPGPTTFDPKKGLKNLIRKGQAKFREYSEFCCGVVLYNLGDPDTIISPLFIFQAMLGPAEMQFDFDPDQGRILEETGRNVFGQHGGQMIQNYDPLEARESTKHIAALIAVKIMQTTNYEFDDVLLENVARRESELGRRLTQVEHGVVFLETTDTCDYSLGRVTRVQVCENPFSNKKLPTEMFRGPYDERHAIVDGRLQRVYVGDKLLAQEEHESSIQAYEYYTEEDAKQAKLNELRMEGIHLIAYYKWQDRGMPTGDPLTDWLAAEAEWDEAWGT